MYYFRLQESRVPEARFGTSLELLALVDFATGLIDVLEAKCSLDMEFRIIFYTGFLPGLHFYVHLLLSLY